MVKSMTGYGRAQVQSGERDVTVEIKSVNHRFFECTVRAPRGLGYLEDRVKKQIGARVSRGKVEASLTVVSVGNAAATVSVNFDLARSYAEALRSLSEPLNLRDDLSLSSIARFGDIFTVLRGEESEDAVCGDVAPAVEEALDAFIAMREREGEQLRRDMLSKLSSIEERLEIVEKRSPETILAHRERLRQKMTELLADRTVDDARILLEAGLYADRVAVDEETVRLRSHIAQFRKILDAPEAVGRKLDFLVQEMNREVNTIGSKAQDAFLAGIVVEMKSDIEKIREQIQNVE